MPAAGKKLSQSDFYNAADDMVKDLEAASNVMQDEIIDIINKPENQGKSTDELIAEILEVI